MSTSLDRGWIEANLPHRGRMSLLHAILRWDEASLVAVARGHRDSQHPLRREGELSIACGIEYGAQAAAAHGALVSRRPSGPGMLASARGVKFHASRLDDITGDLEIAVAQLGASDAGVLYRFELRGAGALLTAGRLAVRFSP
ncbi:MAG TPA: 3-hydroxylacyl-ACP dehydratase [Usitatibacter sp.]|jgi:predicted hotdog family 3-hydroxylacyl-ACP dehydratase|nr:3-hydroxylacyl-ACP dehydratase [Usitatibacter sp.]